MSDDDVDGIDILTEKLKNKDMFSNSDWMEVIKILLKYDKKNMPIKETHFKHYVNCLVKGGTKSNIGGNYAYGHMCIDGHYYNLRTYKKYICGTRDIRNPTALVLYMHDTLETLYVNVTEIKKSIIKPFMECFKMMCKKFPNSHQEYRKMFKCMEKTPNKTNNWVINALIEIDHKFTKEQLQQLEKVLGTDAFMDYFSDKMDQSQDTLIRLLNNTNIAVQKKQIIDLIKNPDIEMTDAIMKSAIDKCVSVDIIKEIIANGYTVTQTTYDIYLQILCNFHKDHLYHQETKRCLEFMEVFLEKMKPPKEYVYKMITTCKLHEAYHYVLDDLNMYDDVILDLVCSVGDNAIIIKCIEKGIKPTIDMLHKYMIAEGWSSNMNIVRTFIKHGVELSTDTFKLLLNDPIYVDIFNTLIEKKYASDELLEYAMNKRDVSPHHVKTLIKFGCTPKIEYLHNLANLPHSYSNSNFIEICDTFISNGFVPDVHVFKHICMVAPYEIIMKFLEYKIVPDSQCFKNILSNGHIGLQLQYDIIHTFFRCGFILDLQSFRHACIYRRQIPKLNKYMKLGKKEFDICFEYGFFPGDYKFDVEQELIDIGNLNSITEDIISKYKDKYSSYLIVLMIKFNTLTHKIPDLIKSGGHIPLYAL